MSESHWPPWEPWVQDGAQAGFGGSSEAVSTVHGLLSAVGPQRIARLQSLYEAGCIIT